MIELTEEELHRIYRGISLIETELQNINRVLQTKNINRALKEYKHE